MMYLPTSSDSDDEFLKPCNKNSYESLREHAWHRCEFCDKILSSRFSNFKHNACHIIIPLIKLTLHQCNECLFHFTSLEELRAHVTAKKHRTSQFPDQTPQKLIRYEEILKSIVEKEALVTLPELYKNNSINNIGLINIYEISSDSDTESPDIPENGLKMTRSNSNGHSSSEKGHSNLENGHIDSEKGHSDSEKGHSNLEKGHNDSEKGHSDSEKGHNHSEKGLSDSEKGHSDSEKEQSDPDEVQSDTLKKEDRESSPFSFDSLKDVSSPTPSLLRELSSPIQPIKSRIMFEDDFDDDLFEAEEILPDNSHHTLSPHIVGDSLSNKNQNTFVFGKLNVNGMTDSVKEECTSIHYDELIVQELCDCRYCGRCFINRLEKIKHETIHMRATFTRPLLCAVCERYIAGNHWTMRRHMQKFHPTHNRKLKIQRCNICHLKYHNYRRHIQYYHQIKCDTCKRSFSKQDLDNHDCIDKFVIQNWIGVEDTLTSDSYKVIKLCEMCLAFAKNRQNIHYEVIGEHSEVGNRQICDKCHSMHFEVSLVRRKVKFREGTEFGRKRRPLSNQERLKKMQKRLKMVKDMNKC